MATHNGEISFRTLEERDDWTHFELERLSSQVSPSRNFELLVCVLLDSGEIDASSSSVFVAVPSEDTDWAGIQLSKDDGRWDAVPSIFRADESLGWFRVGDCPAWLKVLVLLSKGVLDAMIYFIPNSITEVQSGPSEDQRPKFQRTFDPNLELIRAAVLSEASSRIEYFLEAGPLAFFGNFFDAMVWEASFRWSDWETWGVSMDERRSELAGCFGAKVPDGWEKAVPPSQWLNLPAQLKMEARRYFDDPVVDYSFLSLPYKQDASRLEVIAHQDRFFSMGGRPDDMVPNRSSWKAAFPKGELDFSKMEKLWWWKGISAWPEEFKGRFFENWERSALYFEFRVREHRESRGAPFGKPWCWLDNHQRGVLAAVWPSQKVGRYSLRKEMALPLARFAAVEAMNQLDPNTLAERLPEVVAKAMQDLGVVLSPANKRVKPHPDGLSQKWMVIELLDRKYHLKHALPASDNSLIAKLRQEYREACKQVRIEP